MQAASPHLQQQQQPLLVLKNRPAAGSEEGRRQTKISNLYAASKLLPIIRTSLGPRAHQKAIFSIHLILLMFCFEFFLQILI
ncbi:MAG: hypothetical protein MHMPM18_001779 [Marteilia pararefringens]